MAIFLETENVTDSPQSIITSISLYKDANI